MIYFFLNIMLYLITILLLVKYFYHKMTVNNFIIIIFNLNIFFFFIYQEINYVYGLLFLIISLILNYFINLITNREREVVLIKNGNINFHELINSYSYFKLINYLKRHHIKIDDVTYCFKQGERLTIIKDKK